MGRSGAELDALILVFLTEVKKLVISNVKYDLDPSDTDTGIAPVVLSKVKFTYTAETESTYKFTDTVTRTNSRTFAHSSATTYGVDVSVEPGILDIAKITTSFSWSLQETSTNTTETSTQVGLSWGLQRKLDRNKSVEGTTVYEMGQLTNLPYDALITVVVKDGITGSFNEAGTFKNVTYTNGEVTISDRPDAAKP